MLVVPVAPFVSRPILYAAIAGLIVYVWWAMSTTSPRATDAQPDRASNVLNLQGAAVCGLEQGQTGQRSIVAGLDSVAAADARERVAGSAAHVQTCGFQ
jgi:hypothetical protein